MKRDLYAEVTNSIIEAIEKDPGNIVMPWSKAGICSMPEPDAYLQSLLRLLGTFRGIPY